MKKSINLSIFPAPGSGISKSLFTMLSFLITTVLMISCRKEAGEKMDPASVADTTGIGNNVSASAVNTYYISPAGNDNNSGALSSPWKTFDKLSAAGLVAGDLVYVRGGTYRSTKAAGYNYRFQIDNVDGTSASRIRIENYPGESPVINLDDIICTGDGPTGLMITNSSYLTIKGIRITGLAQNSSGGPPVCGMNVDSSPNCIFEKIEVDHCGGYGFYNTNSNNNLYLNCDAHHLDDRYTGWTNANGFNITGGDASTNVTYRNCRAWWVSDDGWDFYGTDGTFTVDNCWSFWNGYEPGTFTPRGDGSGFKLGPNVTNQSANLRRIVKNCLSFKNLSYGFDQNSAQSKFELYNNTSFSNGFTGFNFIYNQSITQQSKNNLSYQDPVAYDGGNVQGSFNSWNGGVTVNNADFLSVSTTGADGARQADGSLPVINFMKLATSSDLINTGVNVGIPYNSTAPDIGFFESGGTTPPPSNQAPSANAGTDKGITLPVNSVSLTGSGSDPDGTIASYAWTRTSGPNTPALSGANTTTLSASNLIAGTYIFRLTVTDNGGLTAFDEVNVVVSGTIPANQPPTANAGTDKAVTLPVNSVSLTGSGSDPGGSVTSYAWTRTSGPNTPALSGAGTTTLSASNLIAGTYVFRLTVTDNGGLTAFDEVNVVVSATPPTNQPPVANAGPDKTITLPVNSVSITGSGTDPGGSITTYTWTRRSGPNTPVLSGANTATLSASNLIAGSYIFRLTVRDNGGLTGYDQVKVTVTASTTPPPTSPINTSAAVADAGFSYYVVQNFGTLADDNFNQTRSVLRIFENGVELNPAHSLHADIETLGNGRFSHWNNGSAELLVFSASDNSDPRTNGRTYTYSITP